MSYRETLDQPIGEFELPHARLRFFHGISHPLETPFVSFHVEERVTGIGVAVTRIAKAVEGKIAEVDTKVDRLGFILSDFIQWVKTSRGQR